MRDLNNKFEASGNWYLPAEPTKKIAGVLCYDQGRAVLALHGSFIPLEGTISSTQGWGKYPVIHGVTNVGAVTIRNAQTSRRNINFNEAGLIATEEISSWSIITGALLPEDAAFSKMVFFVPSLELWLDQPLIAHERAEDGASYSIKRNFQEIISSSEIDAEIHFGSSINITDSNSYRLNAVACGWLAIKPHEPKELDWYLSHHRHLTALLTFLTGTTMSASRVVAHLGDNVNSPPVSILAALIDKKTSRIDRADQFFVQRHSMEVTFEKIIQKWFSLHEKIHAPSKLALSIFSSDGVELHMEFLSLMQALEGFHRALYPGHYMPEDQYRSVKEALSLAIPFNLSEAHKASLKSRINYGNEYALRKRLQELNDLFSENIQTAVFGKLGKLPQEWLDTRNYYTHWDEKISKNTLDGYGMYKAIARLRIFLRLLYLQLLGIPDHALFKALSGHGKEPQYLCQLNREENQST